MLSGQWEDGERERVPMHRSLNRNKDTGKSFTEDRDREPRERKHRKKTKKKKPRSELKEFDEGFDEGSETRQTGNSEESLIKACLVHGNWPHCKKEVQLPSNCNIISFEANIYFISISLLTKSKGYAARI